MIGDAQWVPGYTGLVSGLLLRRDMIGLGPDHPQARPRAAKTEASRRVGKKRADLLLVAKGLAETRERASLLIMEGLVFSPSGRVDKPGSRLLETTPLDVRGGLAYVGRGGLKLAHALDNFRLPVQEAVALDVGASTGGFTDCLLQRGARRVYALDVGYGQLDYRLRRDQRVVVMEKCNARHPFKLDEPVDLVTVDVSFISLTMVIPSALGPPEKRVLLGGPGQTPVRGPERGGRARRGNQRPSGSRQCPGPQHSLGRRPRAAAAGHLRLAGLGGCRKPGIFPTLGEALIFFAARHSRETRPLNPTSLEGVKPWK